MIDIQDTLKRIRSHLMNNYQTSDYLIYGSFVEYMKGHLVTPTDIDITIINPSIKLPNDFSEFIEGIDIPLTITTMSLHQLISEVENIEPKYLITSGSELNPITTSLIGSVLNTKKPHEIRSAISNVSSKAYNKGKKKLTIEDDFDEYLGLKNIYHAFKFVLVASNKFLHYNCPDYEFLYDKLISDLHELRKLIWNTYEASTGTKKERWETLDKVMKPLYNALMTEFRKNFPKESNSSGG